MYLITNCSSSEEYSPYAWFVLEITDEFHMLLQHAQDTVTIATRTKNFQSAEFSCPDAWFTNQDLDANLDTKLAKGIWLSNSLNVNMDSEVEYADCFSINKESIQFVLIPNHTENLRVYSEEIKVTEDINLAKLQQWLKEF